MLLEAVLKLELFKTYNGDINKNLATDLFAKSKIFFKLLELITNESISIFLKLITLAIVKQQMRNMFIVVTFIQVRLQDFLQVKLMLIHQ